MAKDAATQSTALLGLLNGAIMLGGTAGEAYAVSQNAHVKLGPMPGKDPETHAVIAAGTFHEALDLLADALGNIPFSDTATYPAILADISEGGAKGSLVCTPVRGYWPDAMLPLDPGRLIGHPANRCFPLYHYAVSVAVDLPEGGDMEYYCMENPKALVYMPMGDGSAFFAGWCSDLGMVIRVSAQLQDFTQPWTIVKNADGSDYIAPATPMVLADQALNAWLPPEEARKLRGGN